MERRYRRTPEIEATKVDDDIFLVNGDAQSVFHLNATGAGIWNLMAGPISFEEIVSTMVAAFPHLSEADLRRDIAALLDELERHGLVTS